MQMKIVIKSAPIILKNTLESMKMRLSWIMHEEANFLNIKCDVWTGKCKIRERTCEVVI